MRNFGRCRNLYENISSENLAGVMYYRVMVYIFYAVFFERIDSVPVDLFSDVFSTLECFVRNAGKKQRDAGYYLTDLSMEKINHRYMEKRRNTALESL